MTHEEISKTDPESGRVFLREVFIVAFFLPGPIDETVSAIDRAFDLFLAMIPKGAFRWASVGASSEEWKPVSESTIARCKAQLRRDAAAKRKMTSFELVDGDVGGSVPRYAVTVLGEPLDSKLPNERTLFQMSFPIDAVMAGDVDAFVAELVEIAAALPVDSGYGSPAIQWAQFDRDAAIAQTRGIVARHAGYDVNLNTTGRTWLGSRVRGARWLTFLGPRILERLGGGDALRKELPEPFEFLPAGANLLVRAGSLPEIGDMAMKVDTPLLRALAAVLEPVTAFDEVVLLGSLANWDKDVLRKWERRFLDSV
jgi:TseV toxin immunity protein TsiV